MTFTAFEHEIVANDRVMLGEDLPDLSLWYGAEGVVRTSWTYPNRAYEVEFDLDGRRLTILLLHEQVQPA